MSNFLTTPVILVNSAWLVLGRSSTLIVNLLAMIVVARYLGPSEFGKLSYALAFVALIAPIAQLGLNAIVTRNIVRNRMATSRILGTSIALRTIGSLTAIGLGIALISVIRPTDFDVHQIVLILLVGELFKSTLVISHWLEAESRNKTIAISEMSVFGVSALIKICMVVAKAPLIVFAFAYLLESALLAIFLVVIYSNSEGPINHLRFDSRQASNLLKESLPLIVSGLTAVIYFKVDLIMLGQLSGDVAVGTYSVASRLSEAWYFVPNALAISAFPHLINLKKNSTEDYIKSLQSGFGLLFWLAVLVALTVTAISPVIMPFLFGGKYPGSSTILSIHIWAGIFISVRALVSKWLLAENLVRYSVFSQAAGAIGNIILNLILIPKFGVTGAAVSTVVSYSIAGYFSLMAFSQTRPICLIIARSLLAPLNLGARGGRL